MKGKQWVQWGVITEACDLDLGIRHGLPERGAEGGVRGSLANLGEGAPGRCWSLCEDPKV